MIHPLFGPQLKGLPHVFDFSENNPKTLKYDPNNFDQFQEVVFSELHSSGASWGIGKYLEERKNILKNYPQIIAEKRIYHLGLDIIVPKGYELFAPINAIVYETGYESGVGNYGGYIILKHEIQNIPFYSFYGHLNTNHQVEKGQRLSGGERFGTIGEREDSGHWFTHTHLQIMTQQAINEGRMDQGYIAAKDISKIEEYFPTPYPLFRY